MADLVCVLPSSTASRYRFLAALDVQGRLSVVDGQMHVSHEGASVPVVMSLASAEAIARAQAKRERKARRP